ncbi:MAG: hypothetical protein JXB50_16930 [Spirochaetes bacterium]|nr:hypothetical protein [Spirochaetota bacterium]
MNITLRNKTREKIQKLFMKAKCNVKSITNIDNNIYSVIYYSKTGRSKIEDYLYKNGFKLIVCNQLLETYKYFCFIKKLERRVIRKNENKTCNALEKTGSNQENS